MPIQKQNKKITSEIASSNGAIWDEFSEQHYNQSIKIRISFIAQLAHFLMQIRCKFNAQFGWEMTNVLLQE